MINGEQSKLQTWLFAIYIIILPVQVNVKPGLNAAPSDFVLILLFTSYIIGIGRFRIVRTSWSVWHLGLLLSFCLASLVALLRTGYLTSFAILNKDIGLLVLFLIYAVVVNASRSLERVRQILRLLIISVAIQNAVCITLRLLPANPLSNLPLFDMQGPRLSGFQVDPNAYGGLLVVVLCIHIITHCSPKPLVKGFPGASVSLTLAVGVLLTYSRSAWIGLVVLFLTTILLKGKAAMQLLFIATAAFLVTLQMFGAGYFDTMAHLTLRQTPIDSRIRLIEDATFMFREKPVFGVGLGVFEDKFGSLVHNTPLWILTGFGLVGFTFFAGFIFWFISKGMYACRHVESGDKPLIIGLISAHLAMIGLSMGIEALYQRHWWLVMALIAACYSIITMSVKSDHNRQHEVGGRQSARDCRNTLSKR